MRENTPSPTALDKQLKLALHPTTAPDDLRLRLLRVARRQDSRWTWQTLGIAAVLMILLGGSTWGWMVNWRNKEGERFSQAAIQNYMEVKHVDFMVDATLPDTEAQYSQWSSRTAGFSCSLPKRLTGQVLKGACACTMASCRAVCYHLEDGRAVYIFERPLRGLGGDFGKLRTILAANHRAQAWNEDGRGYVLVEPPGWKSVG